MAGRLAGPPASCLFSKCDSELIIREVLSSLPHAPRLDFLSDPQGVLTSLPRGLFTDVPDGVANTSRTEVNPKALASTVHLHPQGTQSLCLSQHRLPWAPFTEAGVARLCPSLFTPGNASLFVLIQPRLKNLLSMHSTALGPWGSQ